MGHSEAGVPHTPGTEDTEAPEWSRRAWGSLLPQHRVPEARVRADALQLGVGRGPSLPGFQAGGGRGSGEPVQRGYLL